MAKVDIFEAHIELVSQVNGNDTSIELNPETIALEDLQWIGAHHEIIKNGEAKKLQTARFAVFYPD